MADKRKPKLCPEKPHIILAEGVDAWNFLIWFLDDLKKNAPLFSTFQVHDFGGIAELNTYLRNIVRVSEFKSIVRSLCIIRDAETDFSIASQAITDALKNAQFAVPAAPCLPTIQGSAVYPAILTGFLLFPGCNAVPKNGTLEDLCLELLAEKNAAGILGDADKALEPYHDELPRLHKNRLHTYFSMTDKFVSLKIGEAAKAGAFRFDATPMQFLKTFLTRMSGQPTP